MNTHHKPITQKKKPNGKGEAIKVMVIEDDPFMNKIILGNLFDSGYTVSSTSDGSKAVAHIEQFRPDVIILDLLLPGMDGKEILATLKKDDTLKTIPVIIFTNLSSDSDKKIVMDLGAAAYLIKVSTEIPELTAKIDSLIR